MAKRQMQRAVATHGNSANATIAAAGPRAVRAFNKRQKFADEEILITFAAIARIDVEAGARIRRDNQKLAELMLLPKILDQIPPAGTDKHLLVFAEAVKKIENRIMPRFIRVVTGR